MLHIVVPEYAWTMAILAHTAVLAVLSMVPLAYGMGPAYGICAGLGGGLFLWRSVQLCREPSRKRAMANFGASLVQFCLLTTGVFLDAAVKWAL